VKDIRGSGNRSPARLLWTCLALGLVTAALYSPVLGHDFITYDDQLYVTENTHVQSGLTRPAIVWAFQGSHASNYHPLTWLSHMLDCQCYGLRPAGHHLTNLLLHTANAILLLLLLHTLTGELFLSAAVAALFAWHPLHVESVAWIAERKDVLSAFFWLLTLLAYTRYAHLKSKSPWPWYFATLGFFVLGLLSKPMVVTLPFILLLLDWWPLQRMQSVIRPAAPASSNPQSATRNPQSRSSPPSSPSSILRSPSSRSLFAPLLREKLPFLALSALGCILTMWAQGSAHAIISTGQLTLGERISHALVSYVHYAAAMFVPVHLAIFYPYPAFTPLAETIGAALLLILISFLALRFRRARPWLLTGWFWFLGTLVPVIGLVQVGDQAWADRYTYLPLIGLFIILVWGAAELARRYHFPLGPVAALAATALLISTSVQLTYWRNTRTLFEHAAKVIPNNYLAITALGSFLAKDGRHDEAIPLLQQALRVKPDYPQAHFFLGHELENRGDLDQAIAEYTAALRFSPYFEPAHVFLGMILARQNHPAEAIAHYQQALELNPESAIAHHNLAKLLQQQGELDEAAGHYAAALRFDPLLGQAHNNLGVILLQKNRFAEGATELRAALRLNAHDPQTECNLAQALNQLGQWADAADLLANAAQANPGDPNLHYQWGLALAGQHKTREAMARYARALILKQDFPEALNALSWILATDPRPELRNGGQAFNMSASACQLTGNQNPAFLLTYAAACAETGRFPEALTAARRAQTLAQTKNIPALAAQSAAMMNSFQTSQPWREPSPP